MCSANSRLFTLIFALLVCAFAVQVLPSCNTNQANAINPSSSNTKLIVVNASPDVGPLAAFINNFQVGNTTGTAAQHTYFRYLTPPAYYSIGTGNLTFQLRTDHGLNLTNDTLTTISNQGYSLFLVGLASIDSLSSVLVADDSPLPALGNGKIRFMNASPRTPALDVYVNGTLGFNKTTYKKVTDYIEVPAGIYEFKLTATGAASNILTDLPRITIQDGKFYTLYSKGLVGHTDTSAISLNLITNK